MTGLQDLLQLQVQVIGRLKHGKRLPGYIAQRGETCTSAVPMSVMVSILAFRILALGAWAALGTLGAAGSNQGSFRPAFWHRTSMHSAAHALGCRLVKCASLASWLALSTCRHVPAHASLPLQVLAVP